MLEFELSNKVKIPAMGIGTFLLSPDQAENSVKAALSCGFIAGGLWVVRLCAFCALGYSDILQFGAVRRVCTPCLQLSLGNQLFVSVVCLRLKAVVRMASQRSSIVHMSGLPTAHCVCGASGPACPCLLACPHCVCGWCV